MIVQIPARTASTAAPGALSVFADLRVETDGHKAHLVGDGQSLVLHSSHPMKLWSALGQVSLPTGIRPASGRRAVGHAAAALQEYGLSVDVRGPQRMIIRLGDGAGSRVGRLVTGSGSVELGSVRELTTALGGHVPLRAIAAAAVAALVIGVGLVGLGRRLR